MEKEDKLSQLYQLIIPKAILDCFEVSKISEQSTTITVELEEKSTLIPLTIQCKKAVLNGFLNPIELQSFPINGKACYLKLHRRRWKEKGNNNQSYYNNYDFSASGTKATKPFGAFLKEYL